MFTDSSAIFLLGLLGLGLIVLMAQIDLVLSRRHSRIVNARYLANLDATRTASDLHWSLQQNRAAQIGLAGFRVGPVVSNHEPGRFSRRRIVTDVFGRTVAVHYEELRMVDKSLQAPLLLVS